MRSATILYGLVAFLCTGTTSLSPFEETLGAQTLFAQPQGDVDVRHYNTVEECLAGTNRISDSAKKSLPILVDTMPYSMDEQLWPESPVAVAFAQNCVNQLDLGAVTDRDWQLYVRLLLAANRDVEAQRIIDRRLTGQLRNAENHELPMNDSQRVAVLDSVVTLYMRSIPIRYAQADSILTNLLRENRFISILDRARILITARTCANALGDTVRLRSIVEQLVQVMQAASDRYSGQKGFQRLQYQVHDILNKLTVSEWRDSLRHSTAAYVALQRANWVKVGGQTGTGAHIGVGEHAPSLSADFWFVAHSLHVRNQSEAPLMDSTRVGFTPETLSAVSRQRPTAGQISLIVFFSPLCRGGGGPAPQGKGLSGCLGTSAALRRLATQFPQLEVTLTAKTAGYFWPLGPTQPSVEATLFSRWLLEYQHLPGVLAVSKTPFWHLDDPDHRRVDELTSNEQAYTFGLNTDIEGGFAFLVDRDGIIIEGGKLDRWTESTWRNLIDVLVHRPF